MKFLFAFIFGAFFCSIAQILIDKTKMTPAKILVSLVIFGIFLGAVGLYEPIFKLAGCGASLPLVGFGGNIAKGVREAIDEKGALGILSGPFTAMSQGVALSLILGLLFSFLSKGKSKRI